MVKVNYELAFLINQLLRENNSGRYMPSYSPEFCVFSNEELSQIKKLDLINFSNIGELVKLPDLKDLIINSVNLSNFTSVIPLEQNPYINHIKDFKPLSNLVQLESLKINNDIYLEELDITPLKNLRQLILTNNPNLKTIVGLDTLKRLEQVIIYGNDLEMNLDIQKYIENTIQSETNVIDISLYPQIVKKNPALGKYMVDCSVLGYTHLKFAEQVAFVDCAIIDVKSTKQMYDACNGIIRKNKVDKMNTLDKIGFAYNFVVKNVKFDNEGLYQRMLEYYKMKEKYNEIPSFIKKKFAMLHSSYTALMYHRSNCEGYVNLMKFMLSLVNVKSYDVHCIDPRYGEFERSNHAMIRIPYKGRWYYCDPTFEHNTKQNYFMLTKEQISKTHILNSYELQLGEVYPNERYIEANNTRKSRY
ncbi:MAG: hypothetical protein PHD10_03790 [Bacilli bacterium]|nr:hypothetical protein [Bacilli bacterium]MDD4608232.1 hypothetical protein [Bacilli bacterium]